MKGDSITADQYIENGDIICWCIHLRKLQMMSLEDMGGSEEMLVMKTVFHYISILVQYNRSKQRINESVYGQYNGYLF